MRSDESKDRAYKNTWKRFQNTVFWCNLKLAQERGLQMYQTRSHAVVLGNILLAACIEIAVCMKTQDELYQKVRLIPRAPQCRAKIELAFLSTRSTKPRRKIILGTIKRFEKLRELCNNTVDHRILGVPLSAVEQQNTTRENKVNRLIEKFENHKQKESFIHSGLKTDGDDQQVQQRIARLDRRHEQHRDLRTLCENSTKQQCPDRNAHREMGKLSCSCGTNMKSTRSPTEFDQNNPDVTSIPGYVIKKNRSRGAKHGASERQRMFYQAKQMLKKGPTGKGRRPSNDTFAMVRQKIVQRVVV